MLSHAAYGPGPGRWPVTWEYATCPVGNDDGGHTPREARSPPATATGGISLRSPRGTSLSQARNCDSGDSSRTETSPVPDFLPCTVSPAGARQGQRSLTRARGAAAGERDWDPSWARSYGPHAPSSVSTPSAHGLRAPHLQPGARAPTSSASSRLCSCSCSYTLLRNCAICCCFSLARS